MIGHRKTKRFGIIDEDLRLLGQALELIVVGQAQRHPVAAEETVVRGAQLGRILDNATLQIQHLRGVVAQVTLVSAAVRLVTRSHAAPNRSRDRRIGLSLHSMPTNTQQIVGEGDSAALVRGADRDGHFAHTPRPAQDFDPAVVPFHQKATDAVRQVLFTDA